MPRSIIAVIVGLCFVVSTLVNLGCGRKDWPEPMAEKEHFSFSDPTGSLQGGCLEIRARIHGKSENLEKLVLEWTKSGDAGDCPTCPFRPQNRVEIPLNAPQLELKKRSLFLTQCGLESGVAYRWRIVGHNNYPGLAPVATRAVYTEP